MAEHHRESLITSSWTLFRDGWPSVAVTALALPEVEFSVVSVSCARHGPRDHARPARLRPKTKESEAVATSCRRYGGCVNLRLTYDDGYIRHDWVGEGVYDILVFQILPPPSLILMRLDDKTVRTTACKRSRCDLHHVGTSLAM